MADQPAAGGAAARGRPRLRALLQRGLMVLIVGAVAWALARNWAQVSAALRQIPPTQMAFALALSLLSPLIAVAGWRVVMADLGSPLAWRPASVIFLVGQLGKYLPGSLWSVLVQAQMAATLGIPRARTTVAGMITILAAVIAGAAAGLPALPALLARQHVSGWWGLLAIFVLALGVWPGPMNRGISFALARLRRPPLQRPLSWGALSQATWWFTLSWVVNGLAVLALALPLATPGTPAGHLLLVCVSGYCLAAFVGMISVFSPAGLGIRDGLTLVFLASVMSAPAAAAVVVLTRFLTVLADLLAAAVAYLWGRQHHLIER